MLDHVFTDAIGALRDAFEGALLERQAFEERFHVDVLLGDMTWETSYGLPGEGLPPRVQADITLEWPTWAQTAYRSWYIGEASTSHRGSTSRSCCGCSVWPPALSQTRCWSPSREEPPIGNDRLDRSGPTVETVYAATPNPEYAIEVCYEGVYEARRGHARRRRDPR